MLKISIIDSHKRRRVVLEGRLTGPWVAELRTAWKAANADLQDRKLRVDLRNVTFISVRGFRFIKVEYGYCLCLAPRFADMTACWRYGTHTVLGKTLSVGGLKVRNYFGAGRRTCTSGV